MTQLEISTHGLQARGILAGKRGLILGIANNRSIAWGIAKAAHEAGAELAFTYQGESFEKRVRPLAQELGAKVLGDCDVTDTATLSAAFKEIERIWGSLDFVVHCVAFSDKDQLTGRYIDTTAENFTNSLLVSCYSFTAVAQRAEKLMPNGGAMLTLTYYGAKNGCLIITSWGSPRPPLNRACVTLPPISASAT